MTSPKEKIEKLERLLARVKERAEAPRPAATAAFAPAPAAAPAHAAQAEATPVPAAVEPIQAREPSLPPPAREPSLAPLPLVEAPPASLEPPVQAKEPSLAPPPPPAREPSLPPPPEVAARVSEPPATQAEPPRAPSIPPDTGWSEPPPPPPPPAAQVEDDDAPEISTSEEYLDSDVEISSEVVELDIDEDDADLVAAAQLTPAESGAQPVADHAANEAAAPQAELEVERASDENEASSGDKAVSVPPVAVEPELVEPPAPPPANEVVDPAPSSSPRPIVAEVPTESAPRHTPPPESGKQVAAASIKPESIKPESIKPESINPESIKPEPEAAKAEVISKPPPSAEGHTMIGGWNQPSRTSSGEPGTGPVVRVPPPPPPPPPVDLAPPPPPPPPPEVVVAAPPPPPPPADVIPSSPPPPPMELEEVHEEPFGAIATNPVLPAEAAVAVVEGSLPTPTGTTFGDLLEASLALSL